MLRKSGTFPQTQVSGAIDKVRVRARLQETWILITPKLVVRQSPQRLR
jgi:hypothetical protein